MKRWGILIAALLAIALVTTADVQTQENFLATAVASIGASTTVTNGTDFTSKSLTVGPASHPVAGVVVVFTRAVGAASTLDVNFEVSYDNGTTWASYDDGQVQVATNHAVISGTTVRYYTLLALYGASHVRLKSMVNNWSGGALTSVNVSLSTSRAR